MAWDAAHVYAPLALMYDTISFVSYVLYGMAWHGMALYMLYCGLFNGLAIGILESGDFRNLRMGDR